MFLLIDIGGTKTRHAFATTAQSLKKVFVVPTPKKFSEAEEFFRQVAGKTPGPLKGVVSGVAGRLDRKHEKVLGSPNLPDWKQKPLRRTLQRIFKAPVYLENDAALGGLGEALYGAGKSIDLIAYVTLSTGVNGVRIISGSIDRNTTGFEIGHHIISVLGQHPYVWEDFVSGIAIQERSKLPSTSNSKEPLWRDVERYVAYGLVNVIRFWSPELIIVGGGVAMSGRINFRRVASAVSELLPGYEDVPKIVRARLGDRAGLLGGLQYLKTTSGK